jgi:glycosyltransferase involved in cell wall biosynthesis
VHVLFLAFEFPPLATAGVFRALHLAAGLPREGCTLDVVTVRVPDYAAWTGTPLDPELADGIAADDRVRVHRISSGFPEWYWSLVRGRAGARLAQYGYWGDPVALFWRRPLFAYLDALIAARRPDVLLATVPPFGVGVLARAAARRYRLPLVADWRDPWTLWRSGPFPSYAHYCVARTRERAILRDANVSVTTSPVTRQDWLETVPAAAPDRMSVIYSGYDGGLIERIASDGRAAAAEAASRVRRIVYVGNFYYDPGARAALTRPVWRRPIRQCLAYTRTRQDWLYRSPYFFLRGLRRAAERDPALRHRVRFELSGPIPEWLPAMVRETGTADLVALLGPVAYTEGVRRQHTADALLLTSARVISGGGSERGRDFSVAGKVGEYFGLRRPILGVLTDGAMRDLVARSGLGLLADPENVDSIADRISRIAAADNSDALVAPDDAFLRSFERRHTVRQMADVLRRAGAEGPRR